ncbi:conserved hypothetical protein [Talaromyces stipitatus ATCC 10500]|uniref:EthD domain-containing protein n=1 Tax=Talaromyces stipitatus (strain ATCC 10500 / CBS 375.48 / QM 6759 / NRRL 1006) TaxID=441959 RepID=B8LZ51_TALSN|nr:uncharacterized protein TSTA_083280 [Talaromyces stipitatus ATCC 10500]EED21095.1 conserved hypothetical protein [Talaromyces stipitatus ATCC 10500]
MSSSRVYCLTICACRKEGMDEDEYHRYLSEHHSNLVKGHLAAKGILSYTMTHNTTETKQMMTQIFGTYPEGDICKYDCFIQIHFKDVLDYIRAKDDPYYKEVILPDHAHFADPANTVFVTGWLETHVINGEAV